MGDFTGMFAIFCIFVAPMWLVMHHATRRRQAQSAASDDDEEMRSELWQIAHRMEAREKALETILDKQIPNWRDKA